MPPIGTPSLYCRPRHNRPPQREQREKVVTVQRIETQFAGRPLTIETGRLARQAAGSATLRFGDTMVLAAVTVSPNTSSLPFFPLTVEYREKTYAAGKIPGGFLKREGRPSDKEILASRLIDRSIRPLFPEGFKNEVQVFVTVLSADQENDADILGVFAAAAALNLSTVPWNGPLAAVRVGRVENNWILNPTFQQLEFSTIDLVVSGSADSIVMVEGGSLEISEAEVLEALKVAQKGIRELIGLQKQLLDKAGAPAKIAWIKAEVDPVLHGQGRRGGRGTDVAGDQRRRQGRARLGGQGRQGPGRRRAPGRIPRTGEGDRQRARGNRVSRDAEAGAGKGRAGRWTRSRHHPADHHRDRRCCRAPTAPRCSPGGRRRRWSPSPSVLPTTSSASTASTWPARPPSRSCSTTTSRHTRRAR